jgi:hypothetical protein
MGTNMIDKINTYICSLDVDLARPELMPRRVVERFMGARNMCGYLLTVSKPNAKQKRMDFARKDCTGDKLIKCTNAICITILSVVFNMKN